jgi:hypothetical protein
LIIFGFLITRAGSHFSEILDAKVELINSLDDEWRSRLSLETDKITESYQRDLDAEHRRTLGLCRTQLHRWAADTFYELFQAPFSDQVWRRKLMEAENMLKPERLVLSEKED